jgi:hypothetical protein
MDIATRLPKPHCPAPSNLLNPLTPAKPAAGVSKSVEINRTIVE